MHKSLKASLADYDEMLDDMRRFAACPSTSEADRADIAAELEWHRQQFIDQVPRAIAALREMANDPKILHYDRIAAEELLAAHGIPLDPRMAN